MKLLNKISLSYILNTSILFMIGLFAIYFSVDWIISEKTDGQLRDTSKEVRLKLSKGINTEYLPLVEIERLKSENNLRSEFKDTTIYLESEKESEAYRQYTVFEKINSNNYRITVRTSLIEKEDLFSAILIVLVSIIATLLVILSVVNRNTAKKIFKPFYNNLDRLESFSLQKNSGLELEDSDILEFTELKNALDILSDKSLKEYRSLKEFSENLSHELQTPVAVIKAKAEMLMQKEFSDDDTNENLLAIIHNTDRLDKLNRSLILLTKLESADLFPTQKINLGEKLKTIMEDYLDIIQAKGIDLKISVDSPVEIQFNESLFEILLGNLISNAIKHNLEKGRVFIQLSNSQFLIKNDGREPKQKPDKYFERFSYDEKSKNSLGLGLAIAKKICDLQGFQIDYLFEKPLHIISVKFDQK